MTNKEATARKKIIAAVSRLVPVLASPAPETRAAARATLEGLRAAEELLSLAAVPAPAPAPAAGEA